MSPEEREYVAGIHDRMARELRTEIRSLQSTARRGTDAFGAKLSAEEYQEIQSLIDRARAHVGAHRSAAKAIRGAR